MFAQSQYQYNCNSASTSNVGTKAKHTLIDEDDLIGHHRVMMQHPVAGGDFWS